MQTMNSQKRQPPPLAIRILLPIASIGSVIVGLLSLSGVLIGFICLIPLGLTYLVLYIWRLQEQGQGKQKAPGRAGRPGASRS
jgi:hypothetical protein